MCASEIESSCLYIEQLLRALYVLSHGLSFSENIKLILFLKANVMVSAKTYTQPATIFFETISAQICRKNLSEIIYTKRM